MKINNDDVFYRYSNSERYKVTAVEGDLITLENINYGTRILRHLSELKSKEFVLETIKVKVGVKFIVDNDYAYEIVDIKDGYVSLKSLQKDWTYENNTPVKDAENYLRDGSWKIIEDKLEPMIEYKVSEAFIKEAHKAACADWKKKLEIKFPEVFKTYKKGQKFKEVGSGVSIKYRQYILAAVDMDKACLVNINGGNRYKDAIEVSNTNSITEAEFQKMCGKGTFELINEFN